MAQPTATHALASLLVRLSDAAALEPPARELLTPELGPREFVGVLEEAGQHVDALKLLAHLLPRREAVWWAWMIARRGAEAGASPEVLAALGATEQWIRQPDDGNRRAAMAAAEAATFQTPAGCAALAAFFSGGSLAPPDAAEVPPPPFMAARAVFGSLILAAVHVQPERAPERFREFLAQGLQLAERIGLWDSLARMR
jgi:hypothetical protein